MRRIFKELHDNLYSPDGIVSFEGKRSLYDILIKSIMIDYTSLIFFYSFIESVKFKIITDTSIKINSYIYSNIELYNQYLPSFLSWKNTYVNATNLSTSKKKNSIKKIFGILKLQSAIT